VEFIYPAFGLVLRSSVSLPGLEPIPDVPAGPVIDFHLGEPPITEKEAAKPEKIWYTSPFLDSEGEPVLLIWEVSGGAFLRLAYSDGMQFWIDQGATKIWAVWPEGFSIEDALTYLFGPVLGLLLRLKGETCLHASAVTLGERVAVFAGYAGAGKSTTAAAFARRGFPVLSDDVVRLEELGNAFYVRPAYPHLSLWPDSVEFLFGSSDALPPFSATWEKRNLLLGELGTQFEARTLPVGAIYILGRRDADRAPSLSELTSQSAFIALLSNSYLTNMLDREVRSKEFQFLARLASAIPVRQLDLHDDPSRLPDLCRIVQEDFESVAK
jgi:hypothetical protein